MIDPDKALSAVPPSLRKEQLKEHSALVQAYAEGRWDTSSLKAARLCEVAYTIIRGRADGSYPTKPSKPNNMVAACKALEKESSLPRGLRILASRVIPGIYEIRNNRDVGHVGSEVASNRMDASLAIASADWLLAELVRVFHDMGTSEAQQVVDALSQRRVPLIWQGGTIRKVLDPKMPTKDQVLVLLDQQAGAIAVSELQAWCEYKHAANFRKVLVRLHQQKLVLYDSAHKDVQILPPGSASAAALVTDYLRRS